MNIKRALYGPHGRRPLHLKTDYHKRDYRNDEYIIAQSYFKGVG